MTLQELRLKHEYRPEEVFSPVDSEEEMVDTTEHTVPDGGQVAPTGGGDTCSTGNEEIFMTTSFYLVSLHDSKCLRY